jgi:hypothetical protein
MSNFNLEDWLMEADAPPAKGVGGNSGMGGQMPGQMPPAAPGMDMGMDPNAMPPEAAPPEQQPPAPDQQMPDDITQDPQSPEMPEEEPEFNDFEVWKNKFFKESIKSDVHGLVSLLGDQRHNSNLQPYQEKFVNDNWGIILLRQDANIDGVSKEMRKALRQQLDRNNPATSVVHHLISALEPYPILNQMFIKLTGYGGAKGDLHRKLIAALLGAVQVGSGANNEDIIFNEEKYSIQLSTRLNARWGDVQIGDWTLRTDDVKRYLSEPEQQRLTSGSPEEKDVLRRRVVIESIAKQFETRAFFINVVQEDGTIHFFGWDIANSLKAAYSEGKLVVKTKRSDHSEAMIMDDGSIVPLIDTTIYFVKETGQQNAAGEPEKEEVEFMERRNGTLFLTASAQTIGDATGSMQGCVFQTIPWNGNPSELHILKKCVYTVYDLLMKQC